MENHLIEKETGGTAMATTKPAPAVVQLFNNGQLTGTVLDFGAGHGRNANFLRQNGLKVYAYDPYNGTSVDGFKGVSNVLPKQKFDVAMSVFVLNVLDEKDEDATISKINSYGKKVFHIVRNKDVIDMIEKALKTKNKKVVDSFVRFGGNPNNFSKEDIASFASVGTDTIKGFQRVPELENKGFNLLRSTSGWKLYSK